MQCGSNHPGSLPCHVNVYKKMENRMVKYENNMAFFFSFSRTMDFHKSFSDKDVLN